MKRAIGIGELFFKTDDPKATKEWYKMHLGLNADVWGCTFWWKNEKVKNILLSGVLLTRGPGILSLLKKILCSIAGLLTLKLYLLN